MAWEFIRVVRGEYKTSDGWGKMYIRTEGGEFEWLCFSYELPWTVFSSGTNAGRSRNNLSRIRFGSYELMPRADGPKGWRLELQNTGHRSNIQIHRAHRSMYIGGCILPVHFNARSDDFLQKGSAMIQTKSVALMSMIQERYEALYTRFSGAPALTISATLPAQLFDDVDLNYA